MQRAHLQWAVQITLCLSLLSPYMAEPCKASRLHEKQGKHCSQAAEIWHYDTLQAESESAAMWHINLQKKGRRRRLRELMRKSIARLHFSILQKKSICDLLLWKKKKLEYNRKPSSSWKRCLAAGCHVKTVSGNSCTLCAHNLSSTQGSAERGFPIWQREKTLPQQLGIDKPKDTALQRSRDGPTGGFNVPLELNEDFRVHFICSVYLIWRLIIERSVK